MAVYYALVTGAGEGCDYSIGCNVDFVRLRAEDKKGVYKEIVRDILHAHGEGRVESVKVIEVAEEFDFDVAKFYADERAAKAGADARKAKESRRQEFEKLKKEFRGDQ